VMSVSHVSRYAMS